MDTLPYIIKDGKFVWGERTSAVTVQEFLSTHNLTDDDVLRIETFDGGGAGWEDAVQLWNDIYPIIRVVGVALSIPINIVKLIRLFTKPSKDKEAIPEEVTPPDAVFCAILSRKSWSSIELAEMLEVERDIAKCFLRACGYTWNPHWQSYIITDEQRETMYKRLDDLRCNLPL